MRLFFDESGNSGADVYDPNQPVFAYAGAWLDAANELHFANFLATLRARHGLQGAGELKGRVLMNSVRGRRAVADILRELAARNVPVSLIGVYKPYFGPGVLVDDCTDYFYNDEFDQSWTWNSHAVARLVQLIIDNADPMLLIDAWRARDGDDLRALRAAYNAVLTQLNQVDVPELQELTRKMARVDLDSLWGSREVERKRGMGYSPNLSAFSSMLQTCETQAEHLDVRNVEIVHDEQTEFRDAFTQWWNVLTANAPSTKPIVYPSGNVQRLNIERLITLTFVNSHNERGVQVADVLASALRVAMHERTTGVADRAADFSGELVSLCAQPHVVPFFIGNYRWQRDAMAMLNLQPAWRLDPDI